MLGKHCLLFTFQVMFVESYVINEIAQVDTADAISQEQSFEIRFLIER